MIDRLSWPLTLRLIFYVESHVSCMFNNILKLSDRLLQPTHPPKLVQRDHLCGPIPMYSTFKNHPIIDWSSLNLRDIKSVMIDRHWSAVLTFDLETDLLRRITCILYVQIASFMLIAVIVAKIWILVKSEFKVKSATRWPWPLTFDLDLVSGVIYHVGAPN